MPAHQQLKARKFLRDGGFNLIELAIVTALLMVTTTSILAVFNKSIMSLANSGMRDAIAAAIISTDLADIKRKNELYACPPPNGNCAVQSLPPTKYTYAPSLSDSGWASFEALCRNTGGNLSVNLISDINTIPNPTVTSQGSQVVIKRSTQLHPNNAANHHLYIVTWTRPADEGQPSQIVRETVLSPTVANWCP